MATSSELDKRPAVDPHEEPSAEWGWHGTFPKGTRIAGWLSAIFCFLMLIGNHHGQTENIWLVASGVSIIALLLWDAARRKKPWRR
ncbi:DUF2631 domain-containing protein [Lentzea sp. DG1S-22]|uniref:DUF2631 domain-containing protein n=1 Tax=unclassified Lentzea TaxID=2643253 RepID=UPI0027E11606|nr:MULTISPECIES: DUF2631 domain-containing protein [unclassified Lentzea]MCG8928436.1 DUF2631 domain-containing protein [Lentzea sp. CC55]WVH80271.1 DUF2631 domain-containing protein [Lentzea sp. DG1S-22]